MSSPSPPRSTIVAVGLLLLCALLGMIGATGWSGWLPAVPTVAALCVGPGIGWQNLRGNLRFTPERLGLAVAISIGSVVVLGLAMNAASISLTRGHWATAVAAVLGGLGAAAVLSLAEGRGEQEGLEPTSGEPRRLTHVSIAVICALIAAGGGLIAWYSQQHWLARQHYTELYAIRDGDLERVTVVNHEGETVSYTARIATAGLAPGLVDFTLDDGGVWTQTIAVEPARATSTSPMLDVELGRAGVPGVYRFIRLVRPQPTSLPAPD